MMTKLAVDAVVAVVDLDPVLALYLYLYPYLYVHVHEILHTLKCKVGLTPSSIFLI
jgi:hypothetical protein